MPGPFRFNLGLFLKRVHLGGLINEAVLHFTEDGLCYVQAIDMSNSISVDIAIQTPLIGFGDLGIGNLGVLEKFFSNYMDTTIEITLEDNRLMFKVDGHGEFKYLLSQTDLIPTENEEPELLNDLMMAMQYRVALTQNIVQDVKDYFSMVKPSTATVKISNGGRDAILCGGRESTHQFTIPLGEPDVLNEDPRVDFEIPIYANKLDAVLNVLEWNEAESPSMYILSGHPVVITTNENNLWVLSPAQTSE